MLYKTNWIKGAINCLGDNINESSFKVEDGNIKFKSLNRSHTVIYELFIDNIVINDNIKGNIDTEVLKSVFGRVKVKDKLNIFVDPDNFVVEVLGNIHKEFKISQTGLDQEFNEIETPPSIPTETVKVSLKDFLEVLKDVKAFNDKFILEYERDIIKVSTEGDQSNNIFEIETEGDLQEGRSVYSLSLVLDSIKQIKAIDDLFIGFGFDTPLKIVSRFEDSYYSACVAPRIETED